MNPHRIPAALLVAALAPAPVNAGEIVHSYSSPDGRSGGVVGMIHYLDARRALGTKTAGANCNFRVDSQPTGGGNDVLLTVYGAATASIDHTGAPLQVRPVSVEIHCIVYDDTGTVVFNDTRAESGAAVPLARAVLVRNDGPYRVCAEADAKYENGQTVEFRLRCSNEAVPA